VKFYKDILYNGYLMGKIRHGLILIVLIHFSMEIFVYFMVHVGKEKNFFSDCFFFFLLFFFFLSKQGGFWVL